MTKCFICCTCKNILSKFSTKSDGEHYNCYCCGDILKVKIINMITVVEKLTNQERMAFLDD